MMKTEEFLSARPPEELLAAIPGLRIREGSGEETRFTARRAQHNEFSRTTLSFVIKGTLCRQETGSALRFRILPGLSSILSFVALLAAWISSLVHILTKNYVDQEGALLFLIVSTVALGVLCLFYRLRKKEVREDLLRLL